ncbi:MAG: hypothetical protein HYV18_01580 [Gammaproteobacteria bacterium]|nr:hypothetical protein [Gammaproteobacteria bacterium]
MKRYRRGIGRALALGVAMAAGSAVAADDMTGRFGAGVSTNALNFGLGPTAEYWLSDEFGVSGSVGVVGDFTTYGVRVMKLFDGPFALFGVETRPYAALGYSSVKESIDGVDADGNGLELVGGFQALNAFDNPNLAWGLEFAYSNVETEANLGESCYPIDFETEECTDVTVKGDYGGFSIGGKLIYFFN